MLKKNRWATPFVTFLILLVSACSSAPKSNDAALESSFAYRDISAVPCELKNLKPKLEYPFGVNEKRYPKEHFTYGVEVEYSLSEMGPGLFNAYAPDAELISHEAWDLLSHEQKLQWVRDNKDKLFPQGPKYPGRIAIRQPEEMLPERLIVDETGNVELVSPKIVDSKVEFEQYLDMLEKRFGEGYVQASVGTSSRHIFKTEANTNEFIGYRFFFGEKDQISKLAEGYAKHLEVPKYIPGKNFTHPYLGPIVNYKANSFRRLIRDNRVGKFEADVLDRVAKRDISHKYTGAVVYRPDIIRKREIFISEIRQCVKDFDCLKKLAERERFFIGRNLEAFAAFENVTHVDTIADFNFLPADVQDLLTRAFNRNHGQVEAEEIIANQVHRNFAYPTQNWDRWLSALEVKPTHVAYRRVKDAQEAYVATLKDVTARERSGAITLKEAESSVRIALAKFAYDSKLTDIFDRYLTSRFGKTAF